MDSTTRQYLIPRAGLIVRDPKNMRQLPPEGGWVSGNVTHWARQKRAGDVFDGEPPTADCPEETPVSEEKTTATTTPTEEKPKPRRRGRKSKKADYWQPRSTPFPTRGGSLS